MSFTLFGVCCVASPIACWDSNFVLFVGGVFVVCTKVVSCLVVVCFGCERCWPGAHVPSKRTVG